MSLKGVRYKVTQGAIYNPWHEWFESFCLRAFPRGGGGVVVLETYLDESVDKEERIMSVAGLVSSSSEWIRFSNSWREIRHQFGVDEEVVFHMTDFENIETPGAVYEPLSGWQKEKRISFLRSLILTAARFCRFAVGAAVIQKDFDAVIREEKRVQFGSPYSWCVQSCMDLVKRWSDAQLSVEPVSYLIEAGSEYAGEMADIFNKAYKCRHSRYGFRLNSLAFVPKGEFLALEPADFMAYEVNKSMLRKMGLDPRPERKSIVYFRECLGQKECLASYFDAEKIEEVISKHPVHIHRDSCWV
jgi:hypothetical protein